jgi:hypothetical protein
MRPIAKITYAAFQVVILAIGTLTANSEPGDLFASIDGAPANSVGFIYKYTPKGCKARLLLAFLALAGWLSTARATCLWQQTSAAPRGVIPRF